MAAALFGSVFVTFFNKLVLVVNLDFEVGLRNTVGEDLGFGLGSLLSLLKIAQTEIHMILVLNRC